MSKSNTDRMRYDDQTCANDPDYYQTGCGVWNHVDDRGTGDENHQEDCPEATE